MIPLSQRLTRVGVCLVLFAACSWTGSQLALRKPLWNDEIYTQVKGIERHSYAGILRGDLAEGNNFPLFYLLQKGVTDFIGYRFEGEWQGEWNVSDWKGQVVLRLTSIWLMALSLTVLFLFFWKEYGWPAGVYAFLTGLSSYMVWAYWAEARPYALWFFLTTVELLVFLRILRKGERLPAWGGFLAVVHVLLSLTIVFGVVQAAAVSFVLWMFHDRNLRPYLGLLVLPAVIGMFYFFHSPGMQFRLVHPPGVLIFPAFPVERLALIGAYTVGLGIYFLRKDRNVFAFRESRYAGLVVLFLMITAGILLIFKWNSAPGIQGFEVSERYFIYLTPLSIIAVMVIGLHAGEMGRNSAWMRWNLAVLFGGLLIWRMMATLSALAASGLYLL